MDKPKCRLCGAKHYQLESCEFPKEDGAVYRVAEAVAITDKPQLASIELLKELSVEKKIEPTADKRKTGRGFDKVAYQREYMRKRRAK